MALITGGSRGLGLQIAKGLGEMGAKIAISARKAGELEEAKADLKKQGIDALTVTNDLSKQEQIPALVDAVVKHYGGIHILVNNAGATWGAKAEEHPLEAWNKVMTLNATSVFALSQAVANRCFIPQTIRKHHRHCLHCGLRAGMRNEGGRLLLIEGRGSASDARARRRMGPVQHSRQCHMSRLLPFENGQRPARVRCRLM